ncbi:MAG: methyltransferase domain-containing protein [bacterium]
MHAPELPPDLFRRMDESSDAEFYVAPRLVTHIDDATIAALTQVYREVLPAGGAVLDLMTSWVSHLPDDVIYGRVAGLGMNRIELQHNPRLTDCVVQDLNREPQLPYADATFDAVINAVSIQYLTRPIEVYAAVRRVLKPGGLALIATSHRCFPTKAIAAWPTLSTSERMRLLQRYFAVAGGYTAAEFVDRSPGSGADPLWVVMARAAAIHA